MRWKDIVRSHGPETESLTHQGPGMNGPDKERCKGLCKTRYLALEDGGQSVTNRNADCNRSKLPDSDSIVVTDTIDHFTKALRTENFEAALTFN